MKKVIKSIYTVSSHDGEKFVDKLHETIKEIQNNGYEVETHLSATDCQIVALLYGYKMEE